MKSLRWLHLLTCVVALGAHSAFAEADVFGLGEARDESLTVPADSSQVVNHYAAVTGPVRKGDRQLRVETLEGFAAGDLVMVLQSAAAGPVAALSLSTFTFGPREESPLGLWELARVSRAKDGVLLLTRPVLNDFAFPGTQVIRVPEFQSVTIHPTGEVRARDWNGSSGGVVAFLVSGTLHNNGVITASGAGPQSGSTSGGGVVFFRANKLTGAGRIEADARAWPWELEGFNQGGAGGSISARMVESADCEALLARSAGSVLLQAASLRGCPVFVESEAPGARSLAARAGEAGGATLMEHGLIIPVRPVITAPGDGANVKAESPLVTGTGDPGAVVHVKLGNTDHPTTPERELPATMVNESGAFSVEVPGRLEDGLYAVTAHTELEGLASPTSDPVYFSVEALLAPAAPVIQVPLANAVVGTAGTGFSGTAETGSTVKVTVDDLEWEATTGADGRWSVPPKTDIEDGTHIASVTATNEDDETSPPATVSFRVDTAPPSAPIITTPAANAQVGAVGTGFSGTAEPSSTVKVTVGALSWTATAAASGGAWSVPVTTDIPAGSSTASVTATDAAGNVSAPTTVTFTVDKTAPTSPIITTPVANASVGTSGTGFSGTAEPSSTVRVTVGALSWTATAASSGGDWSVAVTTDIPEGSRTASVTATDVAGNVSAPATVTFTVDKTAPTAPIITTPAANARVGAVGTGFSGTAEPSSTVKVTVGALSWTATAAASGGAWSVPVTTDIPAGSSTASVTATDAAGNVSAPTTVTFTVDKTAPTSPIITTPAANASVGTSGTGFSGTAEPSSTVRVTVGALSWTTTAAASSDGAWSVPVTTDIPAGSRTASVTATDAAGNVSAPTTVTFTVDKTAPTAPIITTPVANASVGTSGTGFSGTAEPSSTVKVTVGALSWTTTAASSGGAWSVAVTTDIPEGSRTASVTATDAAGNVSAPATVSFTVDKTVPTAPIVTTPAANARVGAVGTGFSGTAEPSSTVRVTVGALSWTATAASSSDGAWSVPVTTDIPEGSRTASVTATDAAGNVSAPTTVSFTVDATVPTAPIITTPVANASVGTSGTGFSGTAEPSSTVKVTVGALSWTATAAASGGAWSVAVTTAIPEGSRTASVTATDAAGNVSAPATVTFTVDKTAPTAPIVTTPTAGSTVGMNGTGFSGTAEPSSTVKVTVGALSWTATAAAGGAWSVPVTTDIPAGSRVASVTATDAAGNISTATTVNFTVNKTPASAPVIQAPGASAIVGPTGLIISGMATATNQVTVRLDDNLVDTVTVAGNGRWSVPANSTLIEGPHTVTARATDGIGNTSSIATVSFTVDATAPNAPVVTAPVADARAGKNGIGFAGTAEAGSTVKVTVGALSWTVTAGANGLWSIAAQTTIPDGNHTASITATDPAGNISPAATVNFTIDTTPPPKPVVTTPTEGAVVGNLGTGFSGTAAVGSTVTVTVGSLSWTAVASGPSGEWSVPTKTNIPEGTRTASITAEDTLHNVSDPTTVTFTVNKTPAVAPGITAPANGSVVGPAGTAFRGTGTMSNEVTVELDDAPLGTVTVAANGQWSVPFSGTLSEGPHKVTAVATNELGNISSTTTSNFTVDLTPPPAPVIEVPTEGARVGTSGTGFSGTAVAGTLVRVTVGGSSWTATAAANGRWSIAAQTTIPDGNRTASVTATDPAGNTSTATTVSFIVDTVPPAAPTVATPISGARVGPAGTGFSGTAEVGTLVTVNVSALGWTATTGADGRWSVATTTAIPDGAQTASVTATDETGNVSGATEVLFSVDTQKPARPVVEVPVEGAHVGPAGTGFSGTAEANSTVRVVVGALEWTTTAGGNTRWTIPTKTDIPEGPRTASVTATDATGNVSDAREVHFTIDKTAPAEPVIVTPVAGARVGPAGTGFSGTAEAGSTVRVTVSGVTWSATTDIDGDWALAPVTTIADGNRTASVTATDAAGNVSPAVTRSFTVDTTPPSIPLIETPIGGAQVGVAGTGFSGTAEAGSTVKVVVGALNWSTTAGADTRWTVPVQTSIPDGNRTASVTATDATGNVSNAAEVSFLVDTTKPDVPVITTPALNARVGVTGTAFTGTAEPSSRVDVVVGTLSWTATTAANGQWSVPTKTNIPDGDHTAVVTATDALNNKSDPATRPFSVDTTPPAKPIITTPRADTVVGTAGTAIAGEAEAGSTVVVTINGTAAAPVQAGASRIWTLPTQIFTTSGIYTLSVTATDATGNRSEATVDTFLVDVTAPTAPVILVPNSGILVGSAGVDFSGTAEAGSTVELFIEGNVRVNARVVAASNGTWVMTKVTTLPGGEHTVTAKATDAAGNTGPASNGIDLEVDITPPSRPSITYPVDGTAITAARPTITGTGDVGTTIILSIDGDERGSTLTTTVGENGTWSFTSPTLTQGLHDLQAKARDTAANLSEASIPVRFTVDSTFNPPLVVASPKEGDVLTLPRPRFMGTSEPNSTVSITLDGKPLATVTADALNNWSYEPVEPLANGPHEFSVEARDAAGNTSRMTLRRFSLDLEDPTPPVLLSPAPGALLRSRRPSIRGTAQPQCRLTVHLNDQPQTPTITVNGAGEWTFTPAADLAEGAYSLTADCLDAFDRRGEKAEARTFTVDATAPGAPLIITPTEGSILGRDFDTITGTAEARTTLTAELNGLVVGTAMANDRGEWTLVVDKATVHGDQALRVFSVDAAGNTGTRSDPRLFRLDFIPPVTTLTGGPTGTSTLANVTFILDTSEEVASFQCSFDGRDPEPCAKEHTLRNLAEGDHTLDVWATDFAGNVEVAPAHRAWHTIRPSLVEGGGVGCASTGGSPLDVFGWLLCVAAPGLVAMFRRRR
ncbi:Ig-like domain-containing protein [Myxococcus sp. K38C18041901]|uniref:Ig-like domain-containing protein n=1 Tax=Myxococcus guangdongensis TaxID=2906760 RepID=UPI0020A7F3F8|nr:Ig-like domain-containing protein [Myxococcus guangdongensis]MCP3060872.1 Ig-like domain-containing protein [Myxococcus guangdongensis]